MSKFRRMFINATYTFSHGGSQVVSEPTRSESSINPMVESKIEGFTI